MAIMVTAGAPAPSPSGRRHLLGQLRRDRVHGVDDDLRLRAQGWALALGIVFLMNSSDHPLLARVGRRTVDAVLA